MLIQVQDQHIARGERKSISACPVALALSEALGKSAWTGLTMVGYWEKEKGRTAKFAPLPEKISAWILDFDGGKEVKPIEFEMNL